jgi:hypothetical protein
MRGPRPADAGVARGGADSGWAVGSLGIFSGGRARITRTAARWLEGNRPMTEKDMAVLAALAGFAWWTYIFLPLVFFHT